MPSCIQHHPPLLLPSNIWYSSNTIAGCRIYIGYKHILMTAIRGQLNIYSNADIHRNGLDFVKCCWSDLSYIVKVHVTPIILVRKVFILLRGALQMDERLNATVEANLAASSRGLERKESSSTKNNNYQCNTIPETRVPCHACEHDVSWQSATLDAGPLTYKYIYKALHAFTVAVSMLQSRSQWLGTIKATSISTLNQCLSGLLLTCLHARFCFSLIYQPTCFFGQFQETYLMSIVIHIPTKCDNKTEC